MELILEFFVEFFGSILSAFVLPDPDKTDSKKKKVATIIFGVFSVIMLAVLGTGIYLFLDNNGIFGSHQKLGKILTVVSGSYICLLIVAKIGSVIIRKCAKQVRK